MDNNVLVLSWHLTVEETLRPLKSIYLVKVMYSKTSNKKYIEIF